MKKGGHYIKIGNHHNIMVIAYEAVVLNKFKNIKVFNRLREMRKMFEWKIIKDLSGIDLGTLTKIDKEITKKLLNIKSTKLDNEKVLLSKMNTYGNNYIYKSTEVHYIYKSSKIKTKKINHSKLDENKNIKEISNWIKNLNKESIKNI